MINTTTNSIKLVNNLTSSFVSTEKYTFRFYNLRNPSSTKPTALNLFQLSSFDSQGLTIDILASNNSLSVQMTQVNSFNSSSFARNSLKN
jgi:hypothetical protein